MYQVWVIKLRGLVNPDLFKWEHQKNGKYNDWMCSSDKCSVLLNEYNVQVIKINPTYEDLIVCVHVL